MNRRTRRRLVVLYAEIAEHTNKLCRTCSGPSGDDPSGAYGCCAPEHCEITTRYAREVWGVDLERGDGPLPLMGPTGCTVAPHLRPICSVWNCALGDPGYTGDPPSGKWKGDYAELRGRIDAIDESRSTARDIACEVLRIY